MRYDRFRTANPTAGGRDALGEAPLLHGASEQAITQLRDTARETRLAARDWLFRVNEPADRLFIVLSGRLQVLAEEDGRVLRELGAGAALGELGLLTGTARSASVRAVRDCRLLEIDADRFNRLVAEDSGLALSIARELARQLQASGGLELSEARPSVFAVVAADSSDIAVVVDELEHALGRCGTVARLTGQDLTPQGSQTRSTTPKTRAAASCSRTMVSRRGASSAADSVIAWSSWGPASRRQPAARPSRVASSC